MGARGDTAYADLRQQAQLGQVARYDGIAVYVPAKDFRIRILSIAMYIWGYYREESMMWRLVGSGQVVAGREMLVVVVRVGSSALLPRLTILG